MSAITAALVAFTLLAVQSASSAAVEGRPVTYSHGQTQLEGYVARDVSRTSRLPVVLVVHDWNGFDEYEQRRAKMLADLGYVGFAVDVYGKGVRPDSPEKNRAESKKYYDDPQLLLRRLNAAIEWIRTQPFADPGRVAAIGYCFGGHAVLDLARSGADVKGVVSFHGSLSTTLPARSGKVKARILALHGTDDSAVGPDEVASFHKELLEAKLGYGWVSYEGAVHGFTVPGRAYNEAADKDSWEQMKRFLKNAL